MDLQITDVTPDNVDKEGFFCYMSKRKTPGFQKKLGWVKARLAEGMRIKISLKDSRSFIEYIPGEHCWRAIEADGYMVVHCIWVVGKKRHGQGHGSYLLNECIKDARSNGMKGVAAVTSKGTWLAEKGLYERNGFESVEKADPSFDLMALRFGDDPLPRFAGDWDSKAAQFGSGFTVLRTDQCPYIEDTVAPVVETAEELGVDCNVVEIRSRKEVMEKMPYPYGTFSIVYDGKPFSYHYLLKKGILKRLEGF